MENYSENSISPHAVIVLIVSPQGIPLVRDPKKPAPNYWKLPGGRGTSSESPIETTIREIKEELGLNLKKEEIEIVYSEERETHNFYLMQCALVSLEGLKSIGNEREEIKLFLPEELNNLTDLFPPHRRILKEIRFMD